MRIQLRILKHLNLSGEEVLFLSDSIEELDAAGKEGIQTCQIDRQKTGNCVHSFNEIEVNPKCTLYSEKGSPLREIHDNEKISVIINITPICKSFCNKPNIIKFTLLDDVIYELPLNKSYLNEYIFLLY